MIIYLADDHRFVRDGLKFFLSRIEDEVKFIETGTFPELLDAIREDNPGDLVIMDLQMPGRSGVDCITELRERFKEIKLIILSGAFSARDVERALGIIYDIVEQMGGTVRAENTGTGARFSVELPIYRDSA